MFQNKVEEVMDTFSPAADGLFTYSRSLRSIDPITAVTKNPDADTVLLTAGPEQREKYKHV